VSGTKKGTKVWENELKPMMEQAKLDFHLIITERKNHARDIIAGKDRAKDSNESDKETLIQSLNEDFDINTFDCIVTVGGDGMVFEVLQGIHARNDSQIILERMKLAAVPSGTGNGLVSTILNSSNENYSALSASFVLVKGSPQPIDIVHTKTQNGLSYLSQLSMGWAIFSDLDVGSNDFSCLGPLRFELATIWFILKRKSYGARISWLPLDQNMLDNGNCSNWVTVEGDFLLYLATQVSHISSDCNVNPASEMGDGIIQIIYCQRNEMSRLDLLKWFLSIDEGTHLDNPYVHVVRCKAVKLQPFLQNGIFALDGEIIEYQPLEQVLLPKAANVMSLMPTNDESEV